jgi:hypothetical protein
MSNSKKLLFAAISCLAVCGLALAGPQWCPDLAPNDTVDFADFAILAENWHKTGSLLQGDFDGNGTVDINDLGQLCSWWLEDYECKSADFNFDYKINFLDFAKLANAWLSDSNNAGWDDKYDLDYSNSIDQKDLYLLSNRWLKTYPEPNDTFDAFKNALADGDIDTALKFIADSSKDKYDEIFQAIGSNLPDFTAGMGTLTLESQDEGRAVYEMTHQNGATTYSFPVVFIKDDDGNWKIHNF